MVYATGSYHYVKPAVRIGKGRRLSLVPCEQSLKGKRQNNTGKTNVLSRN